LSPKISLSSFYGNSRENSEIEEKKMRSLFYLENIKKKKDLQIEAPCGSSLAFFMNTSIAYLVVTSWQFQV
jgi:hypothetical protein